MSGADVVVIGRICIAIVALVIGAVIVYWGSKLYREGIRARTSTAEVVWKDAKFILIGGAPGALLSLAGLAIVLTPLLTFPSFASDGITTTIGTPLPTARRVADPEPEVLRITPHKEWLESLALVTLRASEDAVSSIQQAFAVLQVEVHSGRSPRHALHGMDRNHAGLPHRASVLRQRLEEVDAAANAVVTLMEERAHANQTPGLRRQMLERAQAHRQTVDRQIRNAEAAVTRIEQSVRFYEEMASLARSDPARAASQLTRNTVGRTRADIMDQHQEIQNAIDAILAVAA